MPKWEQFVQAGCIAKLIVPNLFGNICKKREFVHE
jgi:hypothetical protein